MKLNYKSMLAAFSAVMLSGSAVAQSVNLTMKWKAGSQYEIKQSVKLDMKMPNPQDGGDINTKMNLMMGMEGPATADEQGTVVDLKISALSMSMNMGGNAIMSYDSTKPNPENPIDKAMAPLLKLKLKTLFGKDGKFIELKDFDEKLITPKMGFTKDSLESVMKQQSEMVPSHEVKVGETWKATLIAPMQGFKDGLSCNYDFKLASVDEVDGKQIAKINFTADMERAEVTQNGMDMVMSAKNIEGYYLFDVEDGQFTESKSFFDMVAEMEGTEMMMKMNVKIDCKNSPLKK